MLATQTDKREAFKIARAVLERDAAEGIYRPRSVETMPSIVYPEADFITDAAAEADAAKERIAARIKTLPGEGAECERKFTLHLRRPLDPDVDLAEGMEDLFLTACCGNQACAHCWRRRLVRSIRRAASCLLDDNEPDLYVVVEGQGKPEDGTLYQTEKAARQARGELHQQGRAARVEFVRGRLRPRVAAVYIAETTWQQWADFDRSMRRQLPAGTGRLRVRRGDDTVFVVSELPFDGSRCVRPAEAAELVTVAIERLHRRRHAFRLLGCWNDRKPSAWELISKLPVILDQAAVDAHVEAIGPDAKRLGGLPGFLIRSASLADAITAGQKAEAAVLKSFAVKEEKESSRPNSTAAIDGDGFDLEEAGVADGFDPGGNPWGT